MSWCPLPLPDAEVRLMQAWLPGTVADALFEALREGLPWEVHRIRLFGREHASPRLSCWIGDPTAVYRYSGSRFEPHPWPTVLAGLRSTLGQMLGSDFNSVLVNLYRDGRDCMGWHSDDEPELGPSPIIASLSLGGARRFVLKHRSEGGARHAITLGHGDLLVMAGETQRLYRHALPRTARPVAPRINLTFRKILPR